MYEAWRKRVAKAIADGKELDLEDRPVPEVLDQEDAGGPDGLGGGAAPKNQKQEQPVMAPEEEVEEQAMDYIASHKFKSSSKITLDMMRVPKRAKKAKRLVERAIPRPDIMWEHDHRSSDIGNEFLRAAAEYAAPPQWINRPWTGRPPGRRRQNDQTQHTTTNRIDMNG